MNNSNLKEVNKKPNANKTSLQRKQMLESKNRITALDTKKMFDLTKKNLKQVVETQKKNQTKELDLKQLELSKKQA